MRRTCTAAEDDFLSRGNTTIVAPGGEVIAGPLIGEPGVVSAELDMARIAAGRRMFDPTGHYARPDVLSLAQPVRREPYPVGPFLTPSIAM
jgi:nitrilase